MAVIEKMSEMNSQPMPNTASEVFNIPVNQHARRCQNHDDDNANTSINNRSQDGMTSVAQYMLSYMRVSADGSHKATFQPGCNLCLRLHPPMLPVAIDCNLAGM